jgi:linoleoyl-CoA desaturase
MMTQTLADAPFGDGTAVEAVAPGGLKFAAGDEFYHELRRRVERYFRSTGRPRRDRPKMYLKTALLVGWLAASYILLVFLVPTWWLAVPCAVSLGLAMAAVGFNVMHDAGHGAYSARGWVNKIMAMTIDLMGGSSYVWARKHNSIHHTYANITGHDDDINIGLLGRLSPHQRRLPFHRLQQYYLWLLYGLLPVKWLLFDDFWNLITGRIGAHRLARPRGWDLVTFLTGKVAAVTLTFVVPMLLYPIWVAVLFYAIVSFACGVVLSVVFQLAHCVEEASFPMPVAGSDRMDTHWAVHQVQTTVDFARGNRLLSWYVGGLNFQIEHHLFPKICHLHYPALAPLVEVTCREFGVRYVAHRTLFSSLASHFRWLRRMGLATAN